MSESSDTRRAYRDYRARMVNSRGYLGRANRQESRLGRWLWRVWHKLTGWRS